MTSVRLSQGGLRLRFGEPDTPAPEGSVAATMPPRVIAAVSPADPRIKVNVIFRLDGGPERAVSLRPARRTREEQFFEGVLPGLRVGETVVYWVCAELEGRGTSMRLDTSESEAGVRRFQISPGGSRTEAPPADPKR